MPHVISAIRKRSTASRLAVILSRPILALLLVRMMSGLILSPHRTFAPVYPRAWILGAADVGLVVASAGGVLR